jgi:hypothetical protein
MIDQLDAGFDDKAKQPSNADRTYDLVPRGSCRVEIVKAEHKAVEWRASPANPAGECIVLRLRAAAGYSFLFVDLPDDMPWLRQHVARAVGIAADACVPEQLVGRQAQVEIEHVRQRNGRTKAVVKRWTAAPVAARPHGDTATLAHAIGDWRRSSPAKPAALAAKPSRNAVPRHGADDDIPF